MKWSKDCYEIMLLTCDKYLWAVRPFAHLFNKYWDSEYAVRVFGYKHPSFELPSNFSFVSLAEEEYPAQLWSTSLIESLQQIESDFVVLMLEDYWLKAPVKIDVIEEILEYCQEHEEILGVEIGNQTIRFPVYQTIGKYKNLDMVATMNYQPYQFNVQPAMWNRKQLLNLLRPNLSPWQTEREMTMDLWALKEKAPMLMGTRQNPVQYEIAIRIQDERIVHKQLQFSPEVVNELIGMVPNNWYWNGN